MKRRVLCAFALIFWGLAVCTFLSRRIERQMIPQVTVTQPNRENQLPLDCLFDGALYQTYEGSGWEQGTRARLTDPAQYQVLSDSIEMSWGTVIQDASKTPRSGELVEVVNRLESADDYWLAVSADGKALPGFGKLDPTLSVVERTESALLLSAERAARPFMEKRAGSMMPLAPVADDFSPWMDESGETDWESVDWDEVEVARPKAPRIYSLLDLAQWMGQLPKLGLLLGGMLFAVILWAGTCGLSRHFRKNRIAIFINIGLAVALLIALPFLLNAIDLPSSLLPVNNILEIGYYRQEFSQIFGALETFSVNGSATAQRVLRQTRQELLLGDGIVAGSILLGAGITLLETRRTRKSAKKGKHAGR